MTPTEMQSKQEILWALLKDDLKMAADLHAALRYRSFYKYAVGVLTIRGFPFSNPAWRRKQLESVCRAVFRQGRMPHTATLHALASTAEAFGYGATTADSASTLYCGVDMSAVSGTSA